MSQKAASSLAFREGVKPPPVIWVPHPTHLGESRWLENGSLNNFHFNLVTAPPSPGLLRMCFCLLPGEARRQVLGPLRRHSQGKSKDKEGEA